MDRIEELEQRVADLEAQLSLVGNALLSIVDLVKPDHKNFALYALLTGFTAHEWKELEKLIMEAMPKKWNRDQFVSEFEKRLPKRKDMLVPIMEAYQSDKMFLPICALVLDHNL